jgi:uncharacterized protein (DUF2141 family)
MESTMNATLRILALGLGLNLAAAVLPARAADLTIRVDNVQSSSGQVMVALYDNAAGFLKRPKRVASMPASVGSTLLVIKDLAPGDYGFALYHDTNGNGKLDSNPMGIPLEPVAFSNDAQGRMGPPAFDAARVSVPAEGSTVSVKLR